MNILYLLVARGGSKGIKKKNLCQVGGLSLVARKIIGAKKAVSCKDVIVSTDDKDIMDEAREYGAKILFKRPAYLAADNISINSVLVHAMEWVEKNSSDKYDAIMLLEPSSPFTRPADYDSAVMLMESKNCDLVISMVEHKLSPTVIAPLGKNKELDELNKKLSLVTNTNRQSLGINYTPNGCLYLFTVEHFTKHSRIYAVPSKSFGYVMPEAYSVEIDEPIDLEWARFLWDSGKINKNFWR